MLWLAAMPWYAIVLGAAVAVAWWLAAGTKAGVRLYLRLAAIFYASLAVALALDFAPQFVAPLVCTLATAVLALAAYGSFRRPAKPTVVAALVGGGGLAGLVSAFLGEMLFSVLWQFVSLASILVISRRGLIRLSAPSIQLATGAVALFAAASALVLQNRAALQGLTLFSAAGLLGVTLAVARISDTFVRRQGEDRRGAAKRGGENGWPSNP